MSFVLILDLMLGLVVRKTWGKKLNENWTERIAFSESLGHIFQAREVKTVKSTNPSPGQVSHGGGTGCEKNLNCVFIKTLAGCCGRSVLPNPAQIGIGVRRQLSRHDC